MKNRFEQLPAEHQAWIHGYVNGTLDEAEFAVFQDELQRSAPLREVLRRYLALDDHLRRGADDSSSSPVVWPGVSAVALQDKPAAVRWQDAWRRGGLLSAAACVAFGLGAVIMWLRPKAEPVLATAPEPVASGYAVITRLFDAAWPEGGLSRAEGDTLGGETFELAGGSAEIRFFCGASLTLRAPARLTLDSAWAATCHEGSLRVRVPPAARGFRLKAPETEIVDLGTEFGMEVKDGSAQVAVFDGEIALRHRQEAEQRVTAGVGWQLPAGQPPQLVAVNASLFPDPALLTPRFDDLRRTSFARWQAHREKLARDPHLIAYYTFDQGRDETMVPNLAVPRNPERDGAIILAEPVDGRWPGHKQAVEFRRPGSRVRVNIPGEFQAFTFSAWVRIDSLDRRYSALFMGDGYETGEPHWQIRDDGMLMLSVMVDDTRPNPRNPDDAGFHRVYYSPPIWDISNSGQWMHLTSVFDPAGREVRHYANGRRVSHQTIEDEFFIGTLRIGNAEIGNWGEPFRDTPWFAIRHLNGRIDEMAVFKTALNDAEVESLYQQSGGTSN